MTRTKLWRLSLAAILGFGWLFLTPASYSDDPLQIARTEIDQLEADVQKLNDKIATQALIDIANDKYDEALAAKNVKNAAQNTLNSATSIKACYRDWETDRKSTRLNSSHLKLSRMPSSA